MAGKHRIKAELKENEVTKLIDLKTDYDYYISSFGKVYVDKDGLYEVGTYINNYGYECVNLRTDKKYYIKPVHRLVATAFIPNPLELTDVNHKNECKTDNRVENLEWMSHIENMRYSRKQNSEDRTIAQMIELNGLCKTIIDKAQDIAIGRKTRTVYAYNKKTKEQKVFTSADEAAIFIGTTQRSMYDIIKDKKVKNNFIFSYEKFII